MLHLGRVRKGMEWGGMRQEEREGPQEANKI